MESPRLVTMSAASYQPSPSGTTTN